MSTSSSRRRSRDLLTALALDRRLDTTELAKEAEHALPGHELVITDEDAERDGRRHESGGYPRDAFRAG